MTFSLTALGGSWPTVTGLAARWREVIDEYYTPAGSEDDREIVLWVGVEDSGAYLQMDLWGATKTSAIETRLAEIRALTDA